LQVGGAGGGSEFFEGRDLLIDYGGNITFGLPEGSGVPAPQGYTDMSDYIAQQRLVIFKKDPVNTEGIQILASAFGIGGIDSTKGFQFRTNGNQKGQIWLNNGPGPASDIGIYTSPDSATLPLERMTITNEGTVGIWEPNPTHRFVVESPILTDTVSVTPITLDSKWKASGAFAIYREGSRAYMEGYLWPSNANLAGTTFPV